MSILTTDLIAYGAISRPQDDVSTSGGQADPQNRPVFTQLLANSKLVYSSSGADTRVVQATGRDATGSIVTEAVVLNGVTAVSGAQIFERLLVFSITGGASGIQTVTVGGSGIGAGGGGLGQVPPGELGFYCMFINSASDPAIQKLRYEKIFWRNNNAALTLQAAQITLTADPSSKINLGLATTLNDTGSVANRLSAPGGVSFVGVGIAQNVPTTVLPAQQYAGTWILQTLNAGDAALKSTFTTQASGTTV